MQRHAGVHILTYTSAPNLASMPVRKRTFNTYLNEMDEEINLKHSDCFQNAFQSIQVNQSAEWEENQQAGIAFLT